jgi:hypothetical protein
MMNYIKNTGSMLLVLRKSMPDFEGMIHHFADLQEGRLKDHHKELLCQLTNSVFLAPQIYGGVT